MGFFGYNIQKNKKNDPGGQEKELSQQ